MGGGSQKGKLRLKKENDKLKATGQMDWVPGPQAGTPDSTATLASPLGGTSQGRPFSFWKCLDSKPLMISAESKRDRPHVPFSHCDHHREDWGRGPKRRGCLGYRWPGMCTHKQANLCGFLSHKITPFYKYPRMRSRACN